MDKKKVVIFTGGLRDGGAEKQSILLAKALKEKYHIILISYFGEIQLARNITFLNDEKIIFYQLKGNVLKKLVELFKHINKIRPYAIINFLPSNNLFGGIFGRLFNVKKIIGSIRTAKIRSSRKSIQLLLSHHLFNHYTVFNSIAGLKYYSSRGFSTKSLVIQNCLYPLPANLSRKSNKAISILIVARFEDYKDYPTALEAFEMVKKLYPEKDIKLEIVGIGSQENMIHNWIKEHNLISNINLTVNPENINDYFIKSDIFLQTSLVEGFSNSIMEAMGYSLPIIATDVGDNSQMVSNGENGYIVPVKRPDIVVQHLRTLLESSKLRQQMGAKSYEIMSGNYSIEEFANKFVNLIE